MRNKSKINKTVFLESIPVRNNMNWKTDENGMVTLEMENVGFANMVARKILKKPQRSYIHLDETGSFVWLNINGKRSIYEIGELLGARFGDRAEPVYGRLSLFVDNLYKYGFVQIKSPQG